MSAHEESHPGVGHVVPLRTLFGVLGALLVLTALTVAVTGVDLGAAGLLAALAIATVKATLVVLYFMHLRWDRPFHAVVLIASIALVVLFVALALLDREQYTPELIPGYQPGMQR